MTLPETYRTATDLAQYFRGHCKPRRDWRVGLEVEYFPVHERSLRPVPIDGASGLDGLFLDLQACGWDYDRERLSLRTPRGSAITLEPGGQLEIATAPSARVGDMLQAQRSDLRELADRAARHGVLLLATGFHPTASLGAMPRKPSERFRIMRNYMPKVGSRGLDMMHRCCAVQINLDYASETDMMAKLRTAMAVQPLVQALLANAPFRDGGLAGAVSERGRVWRQTDRDRCGLLPFVFSDKAPLADYVDWIRQVPLYSIQADGQYHDVAGADFNRYLAGELPGFEGWRPDLTNWEDHLNSLMPDVRLKRVLEIRGVDTLAQEDLEAYCALWVALLYDDTARQQAWELVADWRWAERLDLADRVPVTGLATEIRGRPLSHWVGQLQAIGRAGAERLKEEDWLNGCSTGILGWLDRRLDNAESPAGRLIALQHQNPEPGAFADLVRHHLSAG
ncbi:MAG: glutamate-cysteine ligase family protein [Marinobacter sp.]|uniref:glutamate--cysteine ligase n=1 Tax=Marinobacter sp. TaxID=50741 RepID=UPI00299EFFD8|nr:glutamate-cysteine ligase family protein [Marinobacter sp.]MDX1635751.1 glutamate-cysteine ligase family protein [Marinobacter sp.]